MWRELVVACKVTEPLPDSQRRHRRWPQASRIAVSDWPRGIPATKQLGGTGETGREVI